MIVLMMILVIILPKNEQISKLADFLRKEHLKKRERIYASKLSIEPSENMKEGGQTASSMISDDSSFIDRLKSIIPGSG